MDISIWSILHDGGLDRILGTVPGNVILHVSLDWVAEEFQTPTGSLDVILNGCTGIEYDEWGSAKQYVGIAELQKLDFQRLEILSASLRIRFFASVRVLRGQFSSPRPVLRQSEQIPGEVAHGGEQARAVGGGGMATSRPGRAGPSRLPVSRSWYIITSRGN